jgi:hypothetical protein
MDAHLRTTPDKATLTKKEQSPMTFPILANAFMLAVAFLTLCAAIATAGRQSVVRVRSNRRRSAGTKG